MSYRTTYYDSETKKRYTIRGKDKKDCERKIKEKKALIERGKDVHSDRTFDYWADCWFDSIKDSGLCKGTLTEYSCAINRLKGEYQGKELNKIYLDDFNRFINALALNNPYTNKPTSKATLDSIVKVARWIFKYASDNRIPDVPDFFSSVRIPKTAPKKKREALNIEQINMIIDTPSDIQPLAMIMLFCGLRRGEVVPLRWSDIDLEKGVLSVSHSVKFENNQPIDKKGGKTDSATRVIPIPPILKDYLIGLKRKAQSENIISPLVCPKNNKIYTETTFKKDWDKFINLLNVKYGYNNTDVTSEQLIQLSKRGDLPMRIEPFTAHCLRHTYATMLYLQGVDERTAMNYMGHSSISVTIDIYTDLKKYCKFDLESDFKEKLEGEYKIKTA